MRSIPTTHGPAAEGVVMDAAELAKILLPLAEPGLRDAAITYPQRGEASNLAPLPLVLRPGESVDIPDTEERSAAVQGTVVSAWFTTLLTIAILFGILAFYARMERRRSDFVSAVTHELRTPLTSFQMMTEMLRNGQVAADKVPEYHENLHRESKRLAHLVENVLSFARLTRGKVRGRQDAGPCRQLLANAFEKHAERLKTQASRSISTRIPAQTSSPCARTSSPWTKSSPTSRTTPSSTPPPWMHPPSTSAPSAPTGTLPSALQTTAPACRRKYASASSSPSPAPPRRTATANPA